MFHLKAGWNKYLERGTLALAAALPLSPQDTQTSWPYPVASRPAHETPVLDFGLLDGAILAPRDI